MEAVAGHFDFPDDIECPTPLLLFLHKGDNGMLAAGGLLDQPAALWFAVRSAGYYWSLLEQSKRPNGLDAKTNGWSVSDWKTYDKLVEARAKIAAERFSKQHS